MGRNHIIRLNNAMIASRQARLKQVSCAKCTKCTPEQLSNTRLLVIATCTTCTRESLSVCIAMNDGRTSAAFARTANSRPSKGAPQPSRTVGAGGTARAEGGIWFNQNREISGHGQSYGDISTFASRIIFERRLRL